MKHGLVFIRIKFCTTLFLALGFCLVFSNCIETFEPNTLTFDEIMVVEATITDETKKQMIFLSKTTPLENRQPSPETEAEIIVADNASNSYRFEETSPGTYVSTEEFGAEFGKDYGLLIITSDGESYASDIVSMAGTAQIDDVKISNKTNQNGTDGVEIRIDGSDLNGNASFFRYEYEETYQIITPFSIPLDLVIVSEDPPRLDTISKTRQERVCYNTQLSNTIQLASTNSLNENSIENFPVHFVARDNSILRQRYSILVKQFVHSREAYSFYETLSDISNLENLFSQLQPGFVEGNISSIEDLSKNVLGIFEVASVSSKRIFFNFREVFPNGNLPSYFVSCNPESDFFSVSPSPSQNQFNQVRGLLNQGYKLISFEEDFFGNIASFTLAPPACGNCNVLGSSVEPDFWEK